MVSFHTPVVSQGVIHGNQLELFHAMAVLGSLFMQLRAHVRTQRWGSCGQNAVAKSSHLLQVHLSLLLVDRLRRLERLLAGPLDPRTELAWDPLVVNSITESCSFHLQNLSKAFPLLLSEGHPGELPRLRLLHRLRFRLEGARLQTSPMRRWSAGMDLRTVFGAHELHLRRGHVSRGPPSAPQEQQEACEGHGDEEHQEEAGLCHAT